MKSFREHMNHFIGFYLWFNLTFIIILGGRQGWNHSILFMVDGKSFGAAGWGEAMGSKRYSESPGSLTTHVLFFPAVDQIPPCASPQSHTQTLGARCPAKLRICWNFLKAENISCILQRRQHPYINSNQFATFTPPLKVHNRPRLVSFM